MLLYRALLYLYPAPFRYEYAGEMAALFAARRRQARGWSEVAAVWLSAVADVIPNAAAVHWELARQDLRYALRGMARAPGFVLTAAAVIALGVGANTAAFSVADYVLVRPLPFREADRVVKLWQRLPGYNRFELSPGNYRDWKSSSTAFEAMGAFTGISVNLTGEGEPERLDAVTMTADVFPLLGAAPALGRLFTAAEDQEGVAGTVLLSWDLWQRRFGGEAGVVGRRVLLDGEPFDVVGVMPRGFNFPRRDVALWTSMRFGPDAFTDRSDTYLQAIGRLRPGRTVADAQVELGVIADRLAREFPAENEGVGANVLTLREELSAQSRLLLLALCGAALCILLVACANLANLLLARAIQRQRELALRTALGAGRERLVRQLLTESVVLAALGGALGLAIAALGVPLLGRLVPDSLPMGDAPALDLRALAVAGLITAVTGLGFGVLPAVRGCGDLDALRDTARARGGRQRLRTALVVSEMVATVVLLVSAGLLLRALWRVQAVDPGFRTAGIMTMRTALPLPKYALTSTRVRFYDRVLADVRALPGVTGAAYVSFLPMAMGGGLFPVSFGETPGPGNRDQIASLRFASPGFFRVMSIPLRTGRDFDARDVADAPAVAVVSESFVRRYWPEGDPLGRRFQFAFAERTVVGVVGDIMVRGPERSSEPQVYLPPAQVDDSSMPFYMPKDLVVRSNAEPAALAAAVGRIVRSVDPDQPVSNVRPLQAIVAMQTAPRQVQARLLAALAGIALLLAGVGVHGLLSYSVSARTREIGVRMALGAAPADVTRMVLRQGVMLAAAGVLPGVALAYLSGRALESLLASVRPWDALTFGAVVGLCLLMTGLGSLLPARRAARTDPLGAMRAD